MAEQDGGHSVQLTFDRRHITGPSQLQILPTFPLVFPQIQPTLIQHDDRVNYYFRPGCRSSFDRR